MAALNKKQTIEVKKTAALVTAAFAEKAETVKDALGAYLEEVFPIIKEQKEEFARQAEAILKEEAGKIIDLSEYTPTTDRV